MVSSATRTSRAALGVLFAIGVLVAAAVPGSAAKPQPEKIFALEIGPNNGPFASCTGGNNANWAQCKSTFSGSSADLTARLINRSPGGNSNFSSFDVYVPSAFTVNKVQTTSADVTGTNGSNASATVTFPTGLCPVTSSNCTTVRVGGIDTVKQSSYVQIAIRVSLTNALTCGGPITSNWKATAYTGTFSSTTFRQLIENPGQEASVPTVVSAADVSHYLTTTYACGNAPVASNVQISGTAAVGQVLTGTYTYSDAENDPEGTSTFRWLRNNVAITGATSSTYTLVSDDAGQTIKFEVTPVAQTGASPGTAVASSGVAVNGFPEATNVHITGTPHVGLELTGHFNYSDAENDPEGTSTFRWLRNGTAITGATSSTYTLVPDDAGKSIAFEVTPVASTGSSPGAAKTSDPVTVATLTTVPCDGTPIHVGEANQVTITNLDSGQDGCQPAVITPTFDGRQLDVDKADPEDHINLKVAVNAFDPEPAINPVPASQVRPPGALHDGLWCDGTESNPTMPTSNLGLEGWCLIKQSTVTYGPDGNGTDSTDWVQNYEGQLIQVSETWLLQVDATLCRTCK